KPIFFARKSTSWRPDSLARSVPSTATCPAVGLSSPATMEIRVVLPQPEGPTRSVSCPSSTSRSTPRKACVLVPLAPNSFLTPRQVTAAWKGRFAVRVGFSVGNVATITALSSKDDGRFQGQNASRADDARPDHNHDDGRPRAQQGQPGHVQASQVRD